MCWRDQLLSQKGWLAGFASDQRGGAAIEFTLWIPAFLSFLLLAADASFTIVTYSQMWNAARETSRNMSIGMLNSEEEAVAFARGFLPERSQFRIDADFDYNFNLVRLEISCDAGEAGVFGILSELSGQTLSATMVVRREWLPVLGSRADFEV